MAIFRKVHTSFWTDPFVEDLTDKQKLFYLYLITNTKAKQCGIYEISKKYMSYETGYSISEINELIEHFVRTDKIYYAQSTNEIAIANWWKYNWSDSPKTIACVKKELLEVKDTALITYLYSTDMLSIVYPYSIDTPCIEYASRIDTQSQEEQEQEQEQEQEELKEEVQVVEQIKLGEQVAETFDFDAFFNSKLSGYKEPRYDSSREIEQD